MFRQRFEYRVPELLDEERMRRAEAGYTAPVQGLCLISVDYGDA